MRSDIGTVTYAAGTELQTLWHFWLLFPESFSHRFLCCREGVTIIQGAYSQGLNFRWLRAAVLGDS